MSSALSTDPYDAELQQMRSMGATLVRDVPRPPAPPKPQEDDEELKAMQQLGAQLVSDPTPTQKTGGSLATGGQQQPDDAMVRYQEYTKQKSADPGAVPVGKTILPFDQWQASEQGWEALASGQLDEESEAAAVEAIAQAAATEDYGRTLVEGKIVLPDGTEVEATPAMRLDAARMYVERSPDRAMRREVVAMLDKFPGELGEGTNTASRLRAARAFAKINNGTASHKDYILAANQIALEEQLGQGGKDVQRSKGLYDTAGFIAGLGGTRAATKIGTEALEFYAKRKLAKETQKQIAEAVKKATATRLRRGALKTAGLAGMTASPVFAGDIASHVAQERMPTELTVDEQGNVHAAMIGTGEALGKAYGHQAVDIASEMAGGPISRGLGRVVPKGVASKVTQALPGTTRALREGSRLTNVQGLPIEMLEERIADVGHAALGDDLGTTGKILSGDPSALEDLALEAEVLGIMQGGRAAVGAPRELARRRYYKNIQAYREGRHEERTARKAVQSATGEEVIAPEGAGVQPDVQDVLGPSEEDQRAYERASRAWFGTEGGARVWARENPDAARKVAQLGTPTRRKLESVIGFSLPGDQRVAFQQWVQDELAVSAQEQQTTQPTATARALPGQVTRSTQIEPGDMVSVGQGEFGMIRAVLPGDRFLAEMSQGNVMLHRRELSGHRAIRKPQQPPTTPQAAQDALQPQTPLGPPPAAQEAQTQPEETTEAVEQPETPSAADRLTSELQRRFPQGLAAADVDELRKFLRSQGVSPPKKRGNKAQDRQRVIADIEALVQLGGATVPPAVEARPQSPDVAQINKWGFDVEPVEAETEAEREAHAFAAAHGVTLHFVRDRKGTFSGLSPGVGSKTVYVRSGKDTDALWQTVGHEVAHALDVQADFSDAEMQQALDRYRGKKMPARFRKALEKDPERQKHEAVATLVGDFLRDPSFRQQLQQSDPTLWQKIRDAVLRLLEGANLRSPAARQVLEQLRAPAAPQARETSAAQPVSPIAQATAQRFPEGVEKATQAELAGFLKEHGLAVPKLGFTRAENHQRHVRAVRAVIEGTPVQPTKSPAPEARQPSAITADTLDRLRSLVERYEVQARKGEGGPKYQGGAIAAGAEFTDYRWKADAVRSFIDRIQAGKSPETATTETKAEARTWIARHNARRPKDVAWQRWEGSADDAIDTAHRMLVQAPAQPSEQAAGRPDKPFTLQGTPPPVKPKPAEFESTTGKQRAIFSGLDRPAGTQELPGMQDIDRPLSTEERRQNELARHPAGIAARERFPDGIESAQPQELRAFLKEFGATPPKNNGNLVTYKQRLVQAVQSLLANPAAIEKPETPSQKFERKVREYVGDDPDDVIGFRELVNEIHAQKVEQAAEENDALDNLIGQFVHGDRRAFMLELHRAEDYDQIPYFDEMLEMAQRDYPVLIQALPGDKGQTDPGHALHQRLKRGRVKVPPKHSDEVLQEALDLADHERKRGKGTSAPDSDLPFKMAAPEKGKGRADFERIAADMPAGQSLLPVEMPELYQLAKELLERPPQVKALGMGKLGVFRGAEGSRNMKILVSPNVAKDEKELAAVLAHEMGHLIDFLPHRTLKRGNIVGRLLSLRKFLKGVHESAPGARNRAVRAELIALSEWWSPYDKNTAPRKYIEYRESSRELYAEALSVFLNTPGELAKRAPTFYAELLNHFDRKPHVVQEYMELQELLHAGPEKVGEDRRANIVQMFEKGSERWQAYTTAKEAARKSLVERWRQNFDMWVLDLTTPAKNIARAASDKVAGQEAVYQLDELPLADNDAYLLLDRTDREIYQPLKAAGITDFDIGEYLTMRRVINDRAEIANPLGFTPSTAKAQIQDLRRRLGKERFDQLQEAMLKWNREIIYPIVRRAVSAGLYNRKMFKDTIEPNIDSYATFAVIHYFEGRVPSSVRRQVGTFAEIVNPWHATLMKLVTLQRHIIINEAKAAVRDIAVEDFPEIRVEAIPPGHREPPKAPAAGKDWLIVFDDGHPRGYEMDKAVVKSFGSPDIGSITVAANAVSNLVYKIFHPLYVTFSPGFAVVNLFRDPRRTWQLLGPIGDKIAKETGRSQDKITLADILRELWHSRGHAYRRARGLHDELIDEMLRDRALATPFADLLSQQEKTLPASVPLLGTKQWPERLRESRHRAIRYTGNILAVVEGAAIFSETLPKVAGYKLLKKRGIPDAERAFTVRKYVGTPDYKQRGHWTPITNAALMYSRVVWNGLQSEKQIAFSKDTALGYWWRRAAYTLVPVALSRLAAHGYLGESIQKLYEYIPQYFLDDYDVIPLWLFPDPDDETQEKLAFLTIPRDDVGRFLGAIFGKIIDAAVEVAGGPGAQTRRGTPGAAAGEVLDELKGALVPDVNPVGDSIGKWFLYAIGVNPRDSFYNENVVPRLEWEAGGWPRAGKMLSWQVDQFGVASHLFSAGTEPFLGAPYTAGDRTTTDITIRNIPGLQRLLRVSDDGLDQQEYAYLEAEEQERARFRLGLPRDTRHLTYKRSFLQRRGQRLSDEEAQELIVLNAWYARSYLPLTKAIRDAEGAGASIRAKEFRDQLESQTEAVKQAGRDALPPFVLGPLLESLTDPSLEDPQSTAIYRLVERQGKKPEELVSALTAYYQQRYRENVAAGRRADMYQTGIRSRNGVLSGYARRVARLGNMFAKKKAA